MRNVTFVNLALVGSALAAAVIMLSGLVTTAAAEGPVLFGQLKPLSGPLANATVTFGAWQTEPILDRYPNASPPTRNQHVVQPNEVSIKAGGSVNFLIIGA